MCSTQSIFNEPLRDVNCGALEWGYKGNVLVVCSKKPTNSALKQLGSCVFFLLHLLQPLNYFQNNRQSAQDFAKSNSFQRSKIQLANNHLTVSVVLMQQQFSGIFNSFLNTFYLYVRTKNDRLRTFRVVFLGRSPNPFQFKLANEPSRLSRIYLRRFFAPLGTFSLIFPRFQPLFLQLETDGAVFRLDRPEKGFFAHFRNNGVSIII